MTNSNLAPHPGESFSEYRERLRAFGVKMPTEKMIKTPKEIEGCREAGRINSLVLDRVEREISVGMSTADIDAIVVSELRSLGATSATLGYEGFPASVCTSLNSVICHGIPSRSEIIREGDIINVDCTSVYGGYFGDASRMFSFGKISDSARRLIDVTREAVEMCVEAIKPYETRLGDIGHIINSHAKKNGFSVVREIGGHGVGLAMHEDPFVCHTGLPGRG
ncbi:MAG: type I methionyl aminopeptidase, partial [Clostridia bacterium]|nr:type I methionyl aminopeptidase [Clostridia bacterium]